MENPGKINANPTENMSNTIYKHFSFVCNLSHFRMLNLKIFLNFLL